jgi:hypothetical protein
LIITTITKTTIIAPAIIPIIKPQGGFDDLFGAGVVGNVIVDDGATTGTNVVGVAVAIGVAFGRTVDEGDGTVGVTVWGSDGVVVGVGVGV